jgi:cyclohexa-1,5-dienecarbonyl-CoA hydratase
VPEPLLTLEHGGALARLRLGPPPGNVLDARLVAALAAAVGSLGGPGALRLLVFEGRGAHFSYGASVEEHLPGAVGAMLAGFHDLIRQVEALGVPTAAVVRGQCLGGGAELAAWCGRVFCEPSARIGLPEVQLGVFPPIGTLALRWRVGGAQAAELVLSGARLPGEDAARRGLADLCTDDAEAALQQWFRETIEPRSAVALRAAWRAARLPLARALAEELPALERLYLDELMAAQDPTEGLRAFLERRPPAWSHR